MMERAPVETVAHFVNLWADAETGRILLWLFWPLYLANWLIIAPVLLLFGDTVLPPQTNAGYKELDFGTELWYSMLSVDTQGSILLYAGTVFEDNLFQPQNF